MSAVSARKRIPTPREKYASAMIDSREKVNLSRNLVIQR